MTAPLVHTLFQGYAFVLGLVFGSFYNVAIHRLPEDRSVVFPRSACPHCGTVLGPSELVPVLSWLWQRGRCRHCGTAISARYPLVELLGGLLGWLVFRQVVPVEHALDPAWLTAWCVFFFFVSALVVQAFVDLRHHIIPDETSVYAIPVGIAAAWLLTTLGFDHVLALTPQRAVGGALFGAAFFAPFWALGPMLLGRPAMGAGDVKLLAMIGAFLGPLAAVFFVPLLASLSGAAYALFQLALRRGRAPGGLELPYGPWLGLAAIAYVLFPDAIRSLSPGLVWLFG